jgi:hypothetical protein
MVRCFHPEFGWGQVMHADPTEPYQLSQPLVLIFVRWESTQGHGVAGGWYDPDTITTWDGAAEFADMYQEAYAALADNDPRVGPEPWVPRKDL